MDTTLYEEWLLGEGLGDSTILNYRGKVQRAHALAVQQGWDIDRLTAHQIRWVADQFPQTRSTLGQLKAALAHYWNMTGTPARLGAIRLPARTGIEEYMGLEDEDAENLDAIAEEALLDGHVREGLAVMFGLYQALRRGEMAVLRWEDFTDDLRWMDVLGKGNKRRWIPVHPVLRERLTPASGYVFPGRVTGHAHTGTIYLWIGELGAAAKVPADRRNPHALRHTCLTRLYEETGDIRLVQVFAGHADPATTAKYTRVSRVRMAAAIEKLDYRTQAA